MSKQLVVSKSFDNYVEIFLQNDREGEQHLEKAAGNFCNMLEAQEAAKAEYQDVTGKVHGFNQLWADRTGKTIGTIEQYNHLAKHSAELRKNLTEVKISALTKHFLSAYAASSPEAQELVEHELEQGRPVTPKQVREIHSGVQDVLEATDVPERQERMRKLSNHVSMPKNYNYTMNISTLKVTADSFANEEGLVGISAEELAGLLYRKMMFIQGKESNPVHMSMYRESLDNMEQMVNRLAEAIALLRSDSLIHSVN
ncbi:hypothetical protein [uncultured Mediterranean phage uvMED]|nr:hypothetical protein [uncultured Mediterranean phage uvMED]